MLGRLTFQLRDRNDRVFFCTVTAVLRELPPAYFQEEILFRGMSIIMLYLKFASQRRLSEKQNYSRFNHNGL